jgi:muramoyltetrapeptide carboxypeptidase
MSGAVSRRQFGNLLAAAALGTGATAAAAPSRRRKTMDLIKPARLLPGDLVGIIAPGGHTNEEALAKAVGNI